MLYLFDVNETLLDLSPLDDVLGGPDHRAQWFDLLIRSALVRTAAEAFRPFGQLGAEAAEALGLEVSAADLRAAMATLPAHPDVAPGLAALADAGHTVAALGNSALDLVEEQLTNAGVRELFHAVHSAETFGALKPAPAAYLGALAAHPGTAAEDAVLVAAHDWDVAGAACAGLGMVYVDRGLRPPLPGLPPDLTVSSITEIAGDAG